MDRELVMLMVMMCCYSASSVIFDGLLECVSFLLLSLCCLLAAFHSLTWSVSAYIFYALFSMQFLCLHRLSVAEDSVFSLYSLVPMSHASIGIFLLPMNTERNSVRFGRDNHYHQQMN